MVDGYYGLPTWTRALDGIVEIEEGNVPKGPMDSHVHVGAFPTIFYMGGTLGTLPRNWFETNEYGEVNASV